MTNSFKLHLYCCSLAMLLLLGACTNDNAPTEKDTAATQWLATWSTGPQLVEPHNMPPEPGLSNNTLRSIVRVTQGGDHIRLRFSNAFSSEPVTLQKVSIAQHRHAGEIDPQTARPVLFSGAEAITMAPGSEHVSDPLDFNLQAGSTVAINIYFAETSKDVTGHPGSRTTSYIAEGNQLNAADLSTQVTADRWYVVTGIEVQAPENAAAVVVLGDSITDGRGSGTNKQNRWPDIFAEKLRANANTQNIAVINQGIGGNCVTRACLGPSALDRFERDVLNQAGVKWLIIFEGINDIGQAKNAEDAEKIADALIAAYQSMINQAHAANIKVYGATLLPFATSFYDTPERLDAWRTVNSWIRNSGEFDAVIDFEAVMTDPEQPGLLRADGDTGDHLHPNENGYVIMGSAVDLTLFQ